MPSAKYRFATLASPPTAADLLVVGLVPYLIGRSDDQFGCGGCGATLVKGIAPGVLRQRYADRPGYAVQCPGCGAFNLLASFEAETGT